jgi:hypothetical protein
MAPHSMQLLGGCQTLLLQCSGCTGVALTARTPLCLNTIPNGPKTLVLPSSLSFAFWTGGLHSNTRLS